ncbi:sensor histidine kinase [Streptomyces sp. NPDC055078]
MDLPTRSSGSPLSARAADTALTVLVTSVVVLWTLLTTRHESERPAVAAVAWLLIAVGCGALWFRRDRPSAVAVITLLACAVYYPMATYDGPLMIAFALALYTVAASGRFTVAVSLAAITLLAVGFGEARQSPGQRQIDDTSLAMLAGWLISLVAIGRAQRTRTAYLHEAEQRALAAEREQEARARQSATEERLRIARELHDILGHSISLINVQSSAVLHKLGKRPQPPDALRAAEEALSAVKATSKDALRELRSTLGVLRQADESAPTAPVPGLERLGELIERARTAGIEVRTHTEGSPRPLPPPVDLAAYRIVQESLTNVTRHARARTARVTIAYSEDDVRLRIEDDGVGSADEGSHGNGIVGMAERARAFGGELTAHNTTEGFRVSARLPVGPV